MTKEVSVKKKELEEERGNPLRRMIDGVGVGGVGDG